MNEFGEKISELRKGKSLTQEALARELDVTAQAVSKWERGESMPDIALLPKLAEVLEVSIDSLFGKEQKPIVEYRPETKKDFDKMILRITVDDDGDRVKVNLPLPFIKAAIEVGMSGSMIKFGDADLSKIDFAAVIKMIENGTIGKIMEVETGDGANICIEVI